MFWRGRLNGTSPFPDDFCTNVALSQDQRGNLHELDAGAYAVEPCDALQNRIGKKSFGWPGPAVDALQLCFHARLGRGSTLKGFTSRRQSRRAMHNPSES